MLSAQPSIMEYNATETGCLESGLYNMHLSSIQFLFFLNNSTNSRKEVKNEEQKKRVEKKNAALNAIRGLIINSSLISKDAKEERLTEVRETITLQRNKVELSFSFRSTHWSYVCSSLKTQRERSRITEEDLHKYPCPLLAHKSPRRCEQVTQ